MIRGWVFANLGLSLFVGYLKPGTPYVGLDRLEKLQSNTIGLECTNLRDSCTILMRKMNGFNDSLRMFRRRESGIPMTPIRVKLSKSGTVQ